MNQKPEYHGMICLSTAHLTDAAINYLEQSCQENNGTEFDFDTEIVTFPKSDMGFFLVIADHILHNNKIPNAIRQCAAYALSHQADWLMFDSDGPIMNELPTYNTPDTLS